MGGNDAPKIWPVVPSDGVDGFKDSELDNRCVSGLGEWGLAARDGCVYRNYVPVQDGIGLCDRRPEQ
jgi:hypothetical protein